MWKIPILQIAAVRYKSRLFLLQIAADLWLFFSKKKQNEWVHRATEIEREGESKREGPNHTISRIAAKAPLLTKVFSTKRGMTWHHEPSGHAGDEIGKAIFVVFQKHRPHCTNETIQKFRGRLFWVNTRVITRQLARHVLQFNLNYFRSRNTKIAWTKDI